MGQLRANGKGKKTMKMLTMTKARVSLLWFIIDADSQRVDPNTGTLQPAVPINGGKRSRFFNKLMEVVESYFPNGEAPQEKVETAQGVRVGWQMSFPDEAIREEGPELANVSAIRPQLGAKVKEFPFYLGDDEFNMAKQFIEAVTRNRLNSDKNTRNLLIELETAFETAVDWVPTKSETEDKAANT